MKIVKYPERKDWKQFAERPKINSQNLETTVSKIFEDVKQNGELALQKYTLQFDKVQLEDFRVTQEEIQLAENLVPDELKSAILLAKSNIEIFHTRQKEQVSRVETSKGVVCWRESRAIERIGIYIPGGSAPLFSTVLMLGIPAKLASCSEIILCTPPDKNGNINPAILFAASQVGITQIFKVGGIQAIAALTFGTETIPSVFKIFGPGNQYVTAAKQEALNYGVAIDMPAGPSEVLVITDESSNPVFVAADLLSQAEHGSDSQVIVLGNDSNLIEQVITEIELQFDSLPRKEIALKALENSWAIVLQSVEECIAFSNVYCPEHLILSIDEAEKFIDLIQNAGSVFLGHLSCESAGDYASGTNHVLPTNAYSKSYSGVSLDSFLKKITFQQINSEGIKNIGPAIEIMAEAEGLMAHKNAVTVRLKYLKL